MAILAFQKPENVIMMDATNSFAKFEFRPLEPGYGITIGNALRRILLSSLEGYAISSIRIDGVNHEFATIPGVLEDVTNIILNLKRVRFRPLSADATGEVISLVVSGKKEFRAEDLNSALTEFEVLNPELVICHLDDAYSFEIELHITKGRGYVSADENREVMVVDPEVKGYIAIDSIYTPILNVKYLVDNFRVEQKTDFEKLIMEVTTDGSIHPQEALKEAARILIEHFTIFADQEYLVEVSSDEEDLDSLSDNELEIARLLETPLNELDLSVRALNCLTASDVFTLGELVSHTTDELLAFRNFGKKTLVELEELVNGLKLSFGMDVSKYKQDKELE